MSVDDIASFPAYTTTLFLDIASIVLIFAFLNVYYRGGLGFLAVCNCLCGTSCIRARGYVRHTGGVGVGGGSRSVQITRGDPI